MSVLGFLQNLSKNADENTRTVMIKGIQYKAHNIDCAECGNPMILRPSKFGLFYGCSTFPECRGTHGAHPDGAPMGTPADPETKKERSNAHRRFDLIWKKKWMSRPEAYQWMQKAMNMTEEEAHIGKFNRDQCRELITIVNRLIKDTIGEKTGHKDVARKGKKARAHAKRRKQRLQEMNHKEQLALHNEIQHKE